MTQQKTAERAGTAAASHAAQARLVEQYKREMLAQARRAPVAPKKAAPKPEPAGEPAPAHEKRAAAGHTEQVLELLEPIVEAVEPLADIARQSGLASAGASAAAKGIELGMEALEHHMEQKRAEHMEQAAASLATTAAAPPPVPKPATPPPAPIDIEINQQIVQTAPAVVTPVIAAPAAAEVVSSPLPAKPLPPLAPPIPIPITPMPAPFPPAPAPASMLNTAAPSQAIPHPSTPAPVARPAPWMDEAIDNAVPVTYPGRRSAPRYGPSVKHSHLHSHRHPQHGHINRRPAHPRRPAACSPCANAWFSQPAISSACTAYTAALAPDDDAMPAYKMPEAVQAAAAPNSEALAGPEKVAYVGPAAPEQFEGEWFKLPQQDYASLEDYLAYNKSRGTLELQVRIASDEGAPVAGAHVDIYKIINGVSYLFYHGVTDTSGSTGRIALPTPEKKLSFTPPWGFIPYATYTAKASHGGYAPQVFENVTVFPDTDAIQQVRLGMEPTLVDEGRYVI